MGVYEKKETPKTKNEHGILHLSTTVGAFGKKILQ